MTVHSLSRSESWAESLGALAKAHFLPRVIAVPSWNLEEKLLTIKWISEGSNSGSFNPHGAALGNNRIPDILCRVC
jgi:hypothetical protein